MTQDELKKLSKVLMHAAEQELMPRFQQCQSEFKTDGSFLTEADLACQNYIQHELTRLWPDYDFMAEEMTEKEQIVFINNNNKGFWCLDPLDGTSNFAAGFPFFSISLALIQDNQVQAGLVYDPNKQECFTALPGQGAWLNDKRLESKPFPLPLKNSIATVDIKRLSPQLRQRLVLQQPYHSQRSLGSVALDWCWLAANRIQVYLHGKQKIWDYAAGLLVAHEAGCLSLGLDGNPVYQLNLEARQVMGAIDETLFNDWKDFLDL